MSETYFNPENYSNKAKEVYEGGELKGPALDFERIFQSNSRNEAMNSPEMHAAKDLYKNVLSIIDTDKFPVVGDNIETIVRALRSVAKEKSWQNYEDINFDNIRAELQSANIPMRPRKRAADFQEQDRTMKFDKRT